MTENATELLTKQMFYGEPLNKYELFQLGNYYYLGIEGVDKDLIKAAELYILSAEQGNPEAQEKLSECYLNDDDTVKKYIKKKVQSYSEKSNSEDRYRLAYCYQYGIGVEKNLKEAIRLYGLSAEQGNHYAQYNLGLCYEKGIGVEKNLKEAAELYISYAKKGNSYAQNRLGYCYQYGIGVDENLEEAIRLYRLSADRGNDKAQHILGLCYEKGIGVKKNLKEAIRLYRLSAEQGNCVARILLQNIESTDKKYNEALRYYNGTGVEKDLKEAVRLFKIIEKDDRAQYMLGVCCENGEGVDEDLGKAFEWYKKSAEKGNADAQCSLGLCYKNGKVVEKDLSEAVRLFRLSAEQGNAKAQYNLGCCYKHGYGVDKDPKKAIRLFELSAEQGCQPATSILERMKKSVEYGSFFKNPAIVYSEPAKINPPSHTIDDVDPSSCATGDSEGIDETMTLPRVDKKQGKTLAEMCTYGKPKKQKDEVEQII